MSGSDIHHNWTSTDTVEEGKTPAIEQGINGAVQKRKVPIRKHDHAFRNAVSGAAGVVMLVMVVMQGGGYIAANLSQQYVEESTEQEMQATLPEEQESEKVEKKNVIPQESNQEKDGVQERTMPVRPSQPALTPPTLDIGDTQNTQAVVPWPARLRINRYTVGSGLVPRISPMPIPVHTVREANEQLHMAPTRQPATGPTLWVVTLLSAASLPFFRKR